MLELVTSVDGGAVTPVKLEFITYGTRQALSLYQHAFLILSSLVVWMSYIQPFISETGRISISIPS